MRVASAAEQLRTAMAIQLAPSERPLLERRLAPARSVLTRQQAAAALADGRNMTANQAIAEALALLVSGTVGRQNGRRSSDEAFVDVV
jgi:hypothetical protein